MIKELATFLFVSIFFFSSLGQTMTDLNGKSLPKGNSVVDSSKIAIFAFDAKEHKMFKKCRPAALTNLEVDSVETLLVKCIREYDFVLKGKIQVINSISPGDTGQNSQYIIDLSQYRRQYIAVVNSNREKEVWINFFCSDSIKDWRERLVMVQDGGNCYFQIKVNLTAMKCYDFKVNGYAYRSIKTPHNIAFVQPGGHF